MKKQLKWGNILMLQAVFLVYSISSVVSKLASGRELFSVEFLLLYGLDILVLGIYALLWQQVIKKFELSVAYANKSVYLIWGQLWAVAIFREHLSFMNIVGLMLVFAGVVVVSYE